MSRGGDDGFLGRWSARKVRAREADRVEPPAPEPEPQPTLPAAPPDLADKTDEEILEELGLPDPDTLGKGDDFSRFLQAAVPARLRNRALRRLWRSNPVLANLDGLNDYDGDFTDAATVVKGGVKTAYKIGRGFLRDESDETVAAAGQAAPTDDPASTDRASTEPEAGEAGQEEDGAPPAAGNPEPGEGPAAHDNEPAPGPDEAAEGAIAVTSVSPVGPEDGEAPPRAPRMRFRFEG